MAFLPEFLLPGNAFSLLFYEKIPWTISLPLTENTPSLGAEFSTKLRISNRLEIVLKYCNIRQYLSGVHMNVFVLKLLEPRKKVTIVVTLFMKQNHLVIIWKIAHSMHFRCPEMNLLFKTILIILSPVLITYTFQNGPCTKHAPKLTKSELFYSGPTTTRTFITKDQYKH